MSSSDVRPVPLSDPWSASSAASSGSSGSSAPGGDRQRHAAAWAIRGLLAGVLGVAALSCSLALIGRRRLALVVLLAGALWGLVTVMARRVHRFGFVAGVATAVVVAIAVPSSIGVVPGLTAAAMLATSIVIVTGTRRPALVDAPPAIASLALFSLLAAGASWVRSNRSSTELLVRPITFTLFLVTAIAVAASHLAPERVARAEAILRSSVLRLASVIGVVMLLVVALPALYLPGAIGRSARRVLHPRRGSDQGQRGWVARTAGLREIRRDARRPFVTTEPRDRRRRLAIAAATVVIAAGGVGVAVAERGAPPGQKGPLVLNHWRKVPYGDLPVFAGVPWADELDRDLERAGIEGNISSTYVNVADGVRRSDGPPSCACTRVRVWLFGGSAAFGPAQRDEGTIASHLVRRGVEGDLSIEIVNMGQNGFTLWNDFEKFAARLALTSDRPDLVIFYDGFNDVVGAVLHTALKGIDREHPTVLDAQESIDYNTEPPSLEPHGGPAVVARLAIDKYAGVRQQIEALAAARGVRTAFFFQPDAFGSRERLADFAEVSGTSVALMFDSEVARTIAEAVEILPPGTINLRSALDQTRTFISPVHHDERGADVVAAAMLRELRPTFDEIRSSR